MKFNIKLMILFVVCFSLGLAGLRSANELWAGALLVLNLWLVGVSVLATIYKSGEGRAWWFGFGLFDAVYLILVFGPWFAANLAPKLGTTQSLEYLHYLATDSFAHEAVSIDGLSEEYGRVMEELKRVRRRLRSPKNDPLIRSLTEKADDLRARIAAIRGYPEPAAAEAGADGSQPKAAGLSTWLPGVQNYGPFLRVGHGLYAILAGLSGATVAHVLCSQRGRREGRSPGQIDP